MVLKDMCKPRLFHSMHMYEKPFGILPLVIVISVIAISASASSYTFFLFLLQC